MGITCLDGLSLPPFEGHREATKTAVGRTQGQKVRGKEVSGGTGAGSEGCPGKLPCYCTHPRGGSARPGTLKAAMGPDHLLRREES